MVVQVSSVVVVAVVKHSYGEAYVVVYRRVKVIYQAICEII